MYRLQIEDPFAQDRVKRIRFTKAALTALLL
jgi:hypothetical protein